MDELLDRIRAWADASEDVRALIIVGSRARVDHPADEWSDLDLLVAATDPARYLSTTDWLAAIGNVWLTFLEDTIAGTQERRVLFEGALDVDFNVFSLEQFRYVMSSGIAVGVLRRGVRVLVDRDGLVTAPPPPDDEGATARPPSEAEFDNVVHDFWYHAIWTAKKLRRGELATAKSCCDSYMKDRLRQMVEWHAQAAHGWEYDTWHEGRFLEEWADPRVVAELRDAFAHYDTEEVRRALFATMRLFRWVTKETASRLGYPYPGDEDARATAWVEACLSGDTS